MSQTHMFHDVDKVVLERESPLKSGDYRTTIRFKDVEIVLFSEKFREFEDVTKEERNGG